MTTLSTKKTSFGWELIKLESELKQVTDPEQAQRLEVEIQKIASHRDATKKMAKATKLHDKGSYKKAASLYSEVIETDVFYVNMAKENLAKLV